MGAALFSFKLIPKQLLGWNGENSRKDFIRPEAGPRRISIQCCNPTTGAVISCMLGLSAVEYRYTRRLNFSTYSKLGRTVNK